MYRPRHTRDERGFARRVGLGMGAGLVSGALAGATAGLLIGIVAFGVGTIGMWLALLAAVVGGSWTGWFLGGIATLEAPLPGEEPGGSAGSDPDGDEEPAIRVRVRPRWPERTGDRSAGR
ncbi:MAG TPA: hypothetical protein VF029_06890 [Actinomycetota bacterium]